MFHNYLFSWFDILRLVRASDVNETTSKVVMKNNKEDNVKLVNVGRIHME